MAIKLPSNIEVGGRFPLDAKYWVEDYSNLSDGEIYVGMHRWVKNGEFKDKEFVYLSTKVWKEVDTGGTGDAATVTVGSVTSGPIAKVTNIGTDTDAKFDFVLPKGDTGKAATINIDRVEISPDGSPHVANIGTPNDAQYIIQIPEGPKGDKGDRFSVDAEGDLTTRGQYDIEPVGFTFLDERGILYFKLENGWTEGVRFRGEAGIGLYAAFADDANGLNRSFVLTSSKKFISYINAFERPPITEFNVWTFIVVQGGTDGLPATEYTLPQATQTILGGIKLGDGLAKDGTGLVYVVPKVSDAVPVTYEQLTGLITGSNLVITGWYLLTDYQTVHKIPRTEVINTGPIEPLLLQATSVNTLRGEGYSTVYKSDLVYYNPVNNQGVVPGCTKGYIYRRIDTLRNNDISYDFRVFKFRRWKEAFDSDTFYTSYTEIVNAPFTDHNVFNEVGYAAGNYKNNHWQSGSSENGVAQYNIVSVSPNDQLYDTTFINGSYTYVTMQGGSYFYAIKTDSAYFTFILSRKQHVFSPGNFSESSAEISNFFTNGDSGGTLRVEGGFVTYTSVYSNGFNLKIGYGYISNCNFYNSGLSGTYDYIASGPGAGVQRKLDGCTFYESNFNQPFIHGLDRCIFYSSDDSTIITAPTADKLYVSNKEVATLDSTIDRRVSFTGTVTVPQIVKPGFYYYANGNEFLRLGVEAPVTTFPLASNADWRAVAQSPLTGIQANALLPLTKAVYITTSTTRTGFDTLDAALASGIAGIYIINIDYVSVTTSNVRNSMFYFASNNAIVEIANGVTFKLPPADSLVCRIENIIFSKPTAGTGRVQLQFIDEAINPDPVKGGQFSGCTFEADLHIPMGVVAFRDTIANVVTSGVDGCTIHLYGSSKVVSPGAGVTVIQHGADGAVFKVNNVLPDASGNVTLSIPNQVQNSLAASTTLAPSATAVNNKVDPIGARVTTLESNPYTLPTATDTIKGGVKIGSGLFVTVDGTVSTPTPQAIFNTSTSTFGFGGVPNGATIHNNSAANGTIGIYNDSVINHPIGTYFFVRQINSFTQTIAPRQDTTEALPTVTYVGTTGTTDGLNKMLFSQKIAGNSWVVYPYGGGGSSSGGVTQAQLDLKANNNSPALTGIPTVINPNGGTDSFFISSSSSAGYSTVGFRNNAGSHVASFGYANPTAGTTLNDSVFFNATNKPMRFSTNGGLAIAMTLENNNIGLGVPASNYRLDVDGSGGRTLRFRNPSSSGYTELNYDNDITPDGAGGFAIGYGGSLTTNILYRNTAYIYNRRNGRIILGTNGIDRLTVGGSGGVGIGTTSPTETLQVVGTIHSTTGGFKFPDGTTQTSAATGGAGGSTVSDIFFKATLTNGGAINQGNFQTIPLNTVVDNVKPTGSGGGWNQSAFTYTIFEAGLYEFIAKLRLPDGTQNTHVNKSYGLAAWDNNIDHPDFLWATVQGGLRQGVQNTISKYCGVGEQIRLYMYLDSFSVGITFAMMSIRKIGPAKV